MWERDGKGDGEGRGVERGGLGEVRKISVFDRKDKERWREGEGKRMEGGGSVCVKERRRRSVFVSAREKERECVCEREKEIGGVRQREKERECVPECERE